MWSPVQPVHESENLALLLNSAATSQSFGIGRYCMMKVSEINICQLPNVSKSGLRWINQEQPHSLLEKMTFQSIGLIKRFQMHYKRDPVNVQKASLKFSSVSTWWNSSEIGMTTQYILYFGWGKQCLVVPHHPSAGKWKTYVWTLPFNCLTSWPHPGVWAKEQRYTSHT